MHLGDSGSPIWTKSEDENKKVLENPRHFDDERAVIVGVISSGSAFTGIESIGSRDQCDDMGTKVTDDIIQWVKEMNNHPPITS